jgi:hypothetical protein
LKIILHLGPHKTGSTTIQRNFFALKKTFANQGIQFVDNDAAFDHLYSAFLKNPETYFGNKSSGLSPEQLRERDAKVLETLYARLNTLRSTAILSNEFLCMLDPEEHAKLHQFLAQHGEVHALYYYRELLPWMSSNCQQMAKIGLFSRPSRYQEAVKRLHEFPLRVAREYGDKAHFIKFEDATRQGICNSLLREFGLIDFDSLGLTETHENESHSDNAVRAMYLYILQNPIGSECCDPEKIAELCALPGEKYQVDGLRKVEIRDYAHKRLEISEKLGFRLAPPEGIPVAKNMDLKNARQIWPYLSISQRLKMLVRPFLRR